MKLLLMAIAISFVGITDSYSYDKVECFEKLNAVLSTDSSTHICSERRIRTKSIDCMADLGEKFGWDSIRFCRKKTNSTFKNCAIYLAESGVNKVSSLKFCFNNNNRSYTKCVAAMLKTGETPFESAKFCNTKH